MESKHFPVIISWSPYIYPTKKALLRILILLIRILRLRECYPRSCTARRSQDTNPDCLKPECELTATALQNP